MRFSILLSLFLSSLSLTLMAFADDSALNAQRQHYLKAKEALDKNQLAVFKQHYSQLGGYPLVQYLDYLRLKDQLVSPSLPQFDEFLSTYRGSLLAERLQANLLSSLASNKNWPDFMRYYKSDFNSAEIQCHLISAKIATGHPTALDETAALWDVGKEQPEACNNLFKRWRAAGKLTQPLVWSRFIKALNNKKPELANQMQLLMNGPYIEYAKVFLKVDAKPELLKTHELFLQQSLPMQQIIANGITKLARKDAKDALKHWELYEAQQLFGDDMTRDTKLVILKQLVKQGFPEAAQQFINQSYALRETSLVEELIRVSLENMDWLKVNEGILMLPSTAQKTERWQYWRARALDELKIEQADFGPSINVYSTLAEKRGFYGFLAADILRKHYSLEDQSKPVDQVSFMRVNQLDGIRRAKELWAMGYEEESRAEWNHTTKKMGADELYAAGVLAEQWGWYATGIRTMTKGNLWDNLTSRFPLAYASEVKRAAQNNNLQPTLVFAIARQESSFAADAKSPVGALGLMQLMPTTAQEVAKKQGYSHKTADLLNPSYNLLLGTSFLNDLLERFSGNRILAAAAYNAGPGRVRQWLGESQQRRPFDVWIETIPFNETRQYVQNVLSFSVIYGYRLGQPQTLVSQAEAKQRL
ncbi:MAG TPA: transglycosylase SLT domain-containing protein [Cellvibrionaceae bacterium]